jgi:hypothetical protein
MARIRNFHESLENDLKRLTAEIKDQRNSPEVMALPEKEVVRRSLEAIETELQPVQGVPPEKSANDQSVPSSVLPTYLQSDKVDPRVKLEVERLVDLVFHESLEKALSEVKHHPIFIQDAFHDALIDKLLPELKARGII